MKLQFYKYYIKPIIEYGLLVYGSTSENQLRPVLILRKKNSPKSYNLPFHASCTHLFFESSIRTNYAMYAGALLKYLLFNFRNIVEKGMSLSHKMKKRRQQKVMLHYAETSKLTENSIQYKAVKLYNMFREVGLWPVGLYQEQNEMLHRFYRDVLNQYLNDNIDLLVFSKYNVLFFTLRSTHLQFQRLTHQRLTHFKI